MMKNDERDINTTAVWSRPALWLLCAGAIGAIVFAAALTFKLLERKRDTEYYNSLSASFFVTTSDDTN